MPLIQSLPMSSIGNFKRQSQIQNGQLISRIFLQERVGSLWRGSWTSLHESWSAGRCRLMVMRNWSSERLTWPWLVAAPCPDYGILVIADVSLAAEPTNDDWKRRG